MLGLGLTIQKQFHSLAPISKVFLGAKVVRVPLAEEALLFIILSSSLPNREQKRLRMCIESFLLEHLKIVCVI